MTAQQSFDRVDSAMDADGERITIYERPRTGELTQRYITTDTVLALEDCR